MRHLARRQGRNPLKFNIAADYAINDIIVNTLDDKGYRMFQLPDGVLINPAWHDQTAEWIYNQLPEIKREKTLDDHGAWDDFNKDEAGAAKAQEWKDRIAKAAVESRTRGKLPGKWQTVIDEFLQPKLEWRSILLDTLVSNARNDYRLFPPNKKHLWRGFYLPSLHGEEINIAMYVDISGSISDKEIQEALSETHGICEQFSDFTIYLRTFDTHITGSWELHPFDPVPQIVNGRGGTNFEEACREAEKLPVSTVVIFSDLEAPFPKQPLLPVIWLSVGNRTLPWGLLIPYPRKEK